MYSNPNIIAKIKNRSILWLGDVVRMEDDTIVKRKHFNGKPRSRRRIGRPRLRWLDDVEDELWGMNVKRWRLKAMDREKWKIIIREAKILNRL